MESTYRIVLSGKAGEGPLLQGWAIVDNTVGQDWDNVQLSLVAGAPQSFVQNLSIPYYTRRPVVPLPEAVAVSPQTYQATLLTGARLSGRVTDPAGGVVVGARVKAFDTGGTVVGETTTDANGAYELAGMADGAMRLRIESPGFNSMEIAGVYSGSTQNAQLQLGAASQTVTVDAAAATIQTSTASGLAARSSRNEGTGRMLGSGAAGGGNTRAGRGGGVGSGSGGGVGGGVFRIEPAARAQELGDLFEYKPKDPITIQKNKSALVPIVQSSIAAEKVSVWNDRAGYPRPQRALWLTNSSGLTLDGGSVSVMEEDTFAGEGIFEPIRPAEKRLVSYATDLALNASSRNTTEQQRVTRVRVSQGVMTHESAVREKKTYTIRNEDTAPRLVIVEHPVRAGYELRSEARPAETTADWMRFRMQVAPKQTAVLVVEEARPIQSTYALTNVTSQQVELFVRQRSINQQVEEALRRILAQKNVVGELDSKKDGCDEEMNKIFDDQQRLRENMKALKGSAEEKLLLQRYTQQLNEQENRLEKLRKEKASLEVEQEKAQEALDTMIEGLSFDAAI